MRGGLGPALCRVRQIIECIPPAGPEASESTVEENEDDIQFVSQTCGRLIPTGQCGAGHRSRYQSGHRGAGHRSGYQSGHRGAGRRSGYQSGHRGAGRRSQYQTGYRGAGHRSGYQSGHCGAGHRSRAFAQREVSAASLAIAETVACEPVGAWIPPPLLLCTWSRWCAQCSPNTVFELRPE